MKSNIGEKSMAAGCVAEYSVRFGSMIEGAKGRRGEGARGREKERERRNASPV